MKKRTISLLLALCMVFSMAMPAVAVDPDSAAIESPAITQETTPAPEELTIPENTTPEADPSQEESAALPEEPTVQEDTVELTDEPAKEPAESATLAAQPTTAPTIPGYTQVTSANLDLSKYYMFISADAQGNLYAFYPAAEHASVSPGTSIEARSCPQGAFVAQLHVDRNTDKVTATWLKNDTALTMDSLHFTMEQGKGYAFKGSNNLYLSLGGTMLSNTSSDFTLSLLPEKNNAFQISTGSRYLVFNKAGDPSEYKPGSHYTTNFWGPGVVADLPVYLYTKDDAVAPIVVNKSALIQAIADAEKVQDDATYTQESRDALKKALQDAMTERDSSTSTVESVRSATNELTWATQALVPVELAPDHPTPATGVTQDQPFINGENGGSDTFRIPALITLNDGSLAAAIDARWDNCPDGFGIDTLFTRSTDGGKTWHYNFPNYFNDSVDQYWGGGKNQGSAAAFIDPVMIQGNDDTIYLLTDVFPGGKYIATTEESTGYETINGEERMVLYTSQRGQSAVNYAYYVGDFAPADANGKAFAPVIAKGDDTMTAVYYLDEHFNLYTGNKKPMYCQQLGTRTNPRSGKYVQQNVFYSLAQLHVRNTTFLWLVTSNDNGQTWSAPTILNPQVRDKEKLVKFYGVGPGAGLTLEDGTIMLPCYTCGNRSDGFTQKASFVYKNPGENTWKRSDEATPDGDWSSESVLVQIDDTTVRHFYRDGHSNLRYTDHVWDEATKTWNVTSDPVDLPEVTKAINNQLSAIRYSKKVNGHDIIMVSTAATGSKARQNGKIYSFILNDDKSMTLLSTYQVNEPGVYYGYSSLTQKDDGSIGLIYEAGQDIKYISISLEQLIPGAIVDGKRNLDLPLYGSYEDSALPLPTAEELAALDPTVVRAELKEDKVIYIGVGEGTTSFTSNGVVTTLRVTPTYPTVNVDMTCHGEFSVPVGMNTTIVNSNPDVISAQLIPEEIIGGQGYTGTDASYTADPVALATALYTFHQNGELYQAVGTGANGEQIWFNPEGTRGIPFSVQAKDMHLTPNADGSFFIQSAAGRYMYFWRDGVKNIFDVSSSAAGKMEAGCKFLLYRPVNEGEDSSKELPGYVPVTEVKDGEQYLIVANVNNTYYVARPSNNGSSAFAHVLRADTNLDSVSTTISNTLTLKALTGGTASVLVDGTAYLVNAQHQLTRVDRVEATATTDGNILYWHCEICGQNFSDEAGTQPVDDVVIPAGTALVPIDPSVPAEHPVQPDGNTPDGGSNTKPAENPATGDSANLGIWLAVFVLAGAGVGVTVYQKKRKHQA